MSFSHSRFRPVFSLEGFSYEKTADSLKSQRRDGSALHSALLEIARFSTVMCLLRYPRLV